MELKFFKHALFGGRSANAIKIGTILTLGRFWVRRNRCHTVYRGQDGVMDYERVQATMDLDDEDVAISGQVLPANTIWHYIRRQVSDCGLESTDSDSAVVRIDVDGEMIPLTPNAPLSLQIEQLSGARLQLRWRYGEIGQEIAPTGFHIFIDSGSGFDFETPDDSVLYYFGGNGEFSWTSPVLTDGQMYSVSVRSYATAAGESQNTNYVSAKADAGGPPAASNLAATWESD